MIIGYTTGVFDLFHIGHLNIIKKSKSMCDKLVVGITTDELVSYKGIKAVIPFSERIEIIRSLKYVDNAVPQKSMDKMEAWKSLKFHKMFVGDDWKGTQKWLDYEKSFKKVGVEIIYFPYTKSVSSGEVRKRIIKKTNEFKKYYI